MLIPAENELSGPSETARTRREQLPSDILRRHRLEAAINGLDPARTTSRSSTEGRVAFWLALIGYSNGVALGDFAVRYDYRCISP